MPRIRIRFLLALALSLAIHAGLLVPRGASTPPPPPTQPLQVRIMAAPLPEKRNPPQSRQAKRKRVAAAAPVPTPREPAPIIEPASVATPQERAPIKQPASMAAPPPPSAEEWKLASTYTLRNSKRYRYNWGQLVRSMMGTAVEGPDQGLVRFRIEIAPDGKIAKVEELWSTSEVASRLARKAIRDLPSMPPTPTGKPLIFEQTISFLPYETGWAPSYKLDCLPEPLPFDNPFAWNGSTPPNVAKRAHRPPPPEGCPPDSTEDTIEEEERSFKRQMEQWRWGS